MHSYSGLRGARVSGQNSRTAGSIVYLVVLLLGFHFAYGAGVGADSDEGKGSSSLILKGGGVRPWHSDDIALQFYATVEVSGSSSKAQTVILEAGRCCHIWTQQKARNTTEAQGEEEDETQAQILEEDCKTIKPSTLLPLDVYPGELRNLSVFYVNKYLVHGRPDGYCLLHLRWRPADLDGSRYTSEEAFKVYFNQSQGSGSDGGSFWSKLWPSSWSSNSNSNGGSGTSGTANDLEVNCLVKYGGHKSYFNPATSQCEETPICGDEFEEISSGHRKLKTVLSPITNKCKNVLDMELNDPGLLALPPSGVTELGAQSYRAYPIKVICVHGSQNGGTTGVDSPPCVCEPGWYSNTFPSKSFNPEEDTFEMCNTRTPNHPEALKSAETQLFILFLLIAVIVVGCIFAIAFYYRKRRLAAKGGSGSSNVDTGTRPAQQSASSVISEVKNRREVVLPPPRPYQTTSKEINTPDGLRQQEQENDALINPKTPSPNSTTTTPIPAGADARQRQPFPHKAKSFDAVAHAVFESKSRQRQVDRERQRLLQLHPRSSTSTTGTRTSTTTTGSGSGSTPYSQATSSERLAPGYQHTHEFHMRMKGGGEQQEMKSHMADHVTGTSLNTSSNDSIMMPGPPPNRSGRNAARAQSATSLTTAMRNSFRGLLTPTSSEEWNKSRPPRPRPSTGTRNPFRRIQGYQPLGQEEQDRHGHSHYVEGVSHAPRGEGLTLTQTHGGQSELFQIGSSKTDVNVNVDGSTSGGGRGRGGEMDAKEPLLRPSASRQMFWPESW